MRAIRELTITVGANGYAVAFLDDVEGCVTYVFKTRDELADWLTDNLGRPTQ